MSWIAVGVTVGTAALGAHSGRQKEKAQERQNLASAEANRYSPWTGKSFNSDYSANGAALDGAMQGGMAGLAMGSQMGKASSTGGTTGAGGYSADQNYAPQAVSVNGMQNGANQSPWDWRQMMGNKKTFF